MNDKTPLTEADRAAMDKVIDFATAPLHTVVDFFRRERTAFLKKTDAKEAKKNEVEE